MKKKWYLGTTKQQFGPVERVYLKDFSWDCGWYWGGGYIGNNNFHCHFDGCFLDVPDIRNHPLGNFVTPWTILPDYIKKENAVVISNGCSIWESLEFFLDDAQYTENEWWRIKDLFKQFYVLREAAEVYRHGGHCSGEGRTEKELNESMAAQINQHIKDVIIPAIWIALDHQNGIR